MDGWIYLTFYSMITSISEINPDCLDFEKQMKFADLCQFFLYISTKHRLCTSQLRYPRWRDGFIWYFIMMTYILMSCLSFWIFVEKISNFLCFFYPAALKLDLCYQTYSAWLHLIFCCIGISFLVMMPKYWFRFWKENGRLDDVKMHLIHLIFYSLITCLSVTIQSFWLLYQWGICISVILVLYIELSLTVSNAYSKLP